MTPKTHIPLGGGFICGTRSVAAAVETEQHLCGRCLDGLAGKLRRAIRDHVAAGRVVTDPEGLLGRILKAEAD